MDTTELKNRIYEHMKKGEVFTLPSSSGDVIIQSSHISFIDTGLIKLDIYMVSGQVLTFESEYQLPEDPLDYVI